MLTQASLNPPRSQSDALVAAPYGGTAGALASSALQVPSAPLFSLPGTAPCHGHILVVTTQE